MTDEQDFEAEVNLDDTWMVEINLQSVPIDTPVEVYGLGAYANGYVSLIPDEMVIHYRLSHAKQEYNPATQNVHQNPDQEDPMKLLNPHAGIRIMTVADYKAVREAASSEAPTDNESPVGSKSEEGSA
jgi:hypothetical protein